MTKSQGNRVDYEERLRRVTDYIHDHLEEPIDLNRLAEVACLSPWHWHRIYRAMMGETVAATVKRLRLHHAAGRLANSEMPIEEIARRAGYGSVHAFSRAFHAEIGMPPATFRKSGHHAKFRSMKGDMAVSDYPVEMREIPSKRLAATPHKGPYMEIGKAFDAVSGWFASRGLLTPDIQLAGVYFDDVSVVPEAELRSMAGMVIDEHFAIEPPLEEFRTQPGPYAVLTFPGPYSNMKAGYDWLFGEWLPHSGREPADAPCLEIYLNTPGQVPQSELLTEICLPLR